MKTIIKTIQAKNSKFTSGFFVRNESDHATRRCEPQKYAGSIFLAKAGAIAMRQRFRVWSGAERKDGNGCAVIATYNALVALNRLNGKSFQDIIYGMEPLSAAMGMLGASPDSLCSFLKIKGIAYSRQDMTNDNYIGFVSNNIIGLQEGQRSVFIIYYWNTDGRITGDNGGAHTVMFTVDNTGTLIAYNGNGGLNYNNYRNYTLQLNDLFRLRRPISIIYVGRTQV